MCISSENENRIKGDGVTEQDAQEQIGQYRQVVLAYEALQAQIQAMLKGKHGADDLSADELKKYRALARERDALQSEMRYFEQQFSEDDNSSG